MARMKNKNTRNEINDENNFKHRIFKRLKIAGREFKGRISARSHGSSEKF